MTAAECLNKGYALFAEEKYADALQCFNEAIRRGSTTACHFLAKMYEHGKGVKQDSKRAVTLYQKVADFGYSNAMSLAGKILISDVNSSENFNLGIEFLKKAADAYDASACLCLAEMLQNSNIKLSNWYLRQYLKLENPNEITNLDFMTDSFEAFKMHYSEKDKVCYFSFNKYILKYEYVIFGVSDISANINKLRLKFIKDFSNAYKAAKNIDNFVPKAYGLGGAMIKEIANYGISVFNQMGIYDLTVEFLMDADYSNLRSIDGYTISRDEPPLEIWEKYEDEISRSYNAIVKSAQAERDARTARRENRSRWEGTSGYDLSDYVANKAKAGFLNLLEGAAMSAVNSVGDLSTSMSESSSKNKLYQDEKTLGTYCIGLFWAIEALKYRIFEIIGYKGYKNDVEKAKRILENLKNNKPDNDVALKMLGEAIATDPFNLDIYEYGLIRFGDAELEFENIALVMSLKEEIDNLKRDIFWKRLKYNQNISKALKDRILNREDPVSSLINEDVITYAALKSDFEIIKNEAMRLQLQIWNDDYIALTYDTYKTLLESMERDEEYKKRSGKGKRIETFDCGEDDMEYFEVPEGITEIGSYAFVNCKNLKSIKLPRTLKKIEPYAFYNCPIVALKIPKGTVEVAINLTNQKTVVYLPNTVERIVGNYLITPSCVKFSFHFADFPLIRDYFRYNSRQDLVSVLTEEEAKKNYKSGKTFVTNATEIKNSVFSNEKIFKDKIFEVNLPFVGNIYEGAFANSKVRSVRIGWYLRTVGDNAFSNCEKLTSLTLPLGTEKIGKAICKGCKNLKFLSIPDTVTEIGEDIILETNATIYCTPKSFAAQYCKQNNLPMKDGAKEIYEKSKITAENSSNADEMADALSGYIDAAEMGNPEAAYEAGKCYMNKLGTDFKSVSMASSYFKKAVDAGHKGAMFELYKIYKDSSHYEENKLAEKWLEQSGYTLEEETKSKPLPTGNKTLPKEIKPSPAENKSLPTVSKTSNKNTNTAPIKGYEELLKFREKLFEEYSILDCVYFYEKGEKSKDKFSNAIEEYAFGADGETIFFLYDDTLFGAADDGFLVTNKTIYYHNPLEDFDFIMLDEIDKITAVEKGIMIYCGEESYKISTSLVNDLVTSQLVKLINEIKDNVVG